MQIDSAQSLETQLLDFIREQLLDKGIAITRETAFTEVGIDSFALIEIILFIERRFGIALPDELLTKENIHSVQNLAACSFNFQQQA